MYSTSIVLDVFPDSVRARFAAHSIQSSFSIRSQIVNNTGIVDAVIAEATPSKSHVKPANRDVTKLAILVPSVYIPWQHLY